MSCLLIGIQYPCNSWSWERKWLQIKISREQKRTKKRKKMDSGVVKISMWNLHHPFNSHWIKQVVHDMCRSWISSTSSTDVPIWYAGVRTDVSQPDFQGVAFLWSRLHTNTEKRREGDHPLIINVVTSRLTTSLQRVVLKFYMHQDHLSNFKKMQNPELLPQEIYI